MRALIVEDSPTLCSIYEAYLAGLGPSISVAETFAGAESLIESNTPDLILLDIELPDGNGLDLLPKNTGTQTGTGVDCNDRAWY